jgi:ribonuclease Y
MPHTRHRFLHTHQFYILFREQIILIPIAIATFACSLVLGILGHLGYALLQHRRAHIVAQQILSSARQAKQHRLRLWEDFYKEKHLWQTAAQATLQKLEQNLKEWSQKLERRESEIGIWEKKLRQFEDNNLFEQQQIEQEQKLHATMEKQLIQRREQTRNALLSCCHTNMQKMREQTLDDLKQHLRSEGETYCSHVSEILQNNAKRMAPRILAAAIHRYCLALNGDFNLVPGNDGNLQKNISYQPELMSLITKEFHVEATYDKESTLLTIHTPDGYKREHIRRVLGVIVDLDGLKNNKFRDIIRKVDEEMDREAQELGEKTVQMVGCQIVSELAKLLGRLKYRTSFSQNILEHSIEVAYVAKFLAVEIGLNPQLAFRAGLLHDIGKSLDYEKEGGHPEIGGEILQKFGESSEIVESVRKHHDDNYSGNPYVAIIRAADAVSAARPGARREMVETYIKRLESLEAVARHLPGIENAFAISAGRELRVMVNPAKVTDRQAAHLAKDIANKIEENFHYPGKIKITVIREMKVEQYAK